MEKQNNQIYPIIFLFTHPRAVSTAFERIMIERGDLTVLHEPFSQMYYHHYRKAPAVNCGEKTNKNYTQVKEEIFAAASKNPVFIKDMAYHVFPQMITDTAFLCNPNITFTILIRDPKKSIASHYKMNPKVTYEELGYETLYFIYKKLIGLDRQVHIINADKLESIPNKTIEQYCSFVKLAYKPSSLEWHKANTLKEWNTWKDWHAEASASTHIYINRKRYHSNAILFPEIRGDDRSKIINYYQNCQRFYDKLRTKEG